jgi:hypothetical protein
MKNKEYNQKACQQETTNRFYENYRVIKPVVSLRILSSGPSKCTKTFTSHYNLWYQKEKEIVPEPEPEPQGYEDYPIEIKDYNYVYRGWNYPYELCQ